MDINYTIPLWGIITIVGTSIITISWSLINTYFISKANKKSIEKIEKEMYYQEKAINSFKKDIEQKLDEHKKATDTKLSDISHIVIETKTLVKLLVDNKIKKND